ncbi:MAG TPA: hypothetical protein VGL77_06920 [Armatimonadota bacterium]|jgi:hypothetical protein
METMQTAVAEKDQLVAVVIHWGWVTPGVADCNRRLQEGQYLEFLATDGCDKGTFNFTQPGWVLDSGMHTTVRAVTRDNVEPGKRGVPFSSETLDALRHAVRDDTLNYLAYPYAGAIVEGMMGESALQAYRLTRTVVRENLQSEPLGFFVHDGPTVLNWTCHMLPQIGWLAGYRYLFGTYSALVESPDGTALMMFGRPDAGASYLYNVVELMDAPQQVRDLCAEHREEQLSFVSADCLPALNATVARRESSLRLLTKGWYGGTPLVMQMQAALRRTDQALSVLETLQTLMGVHVDLTDYWKRSLIMQDCHLQWLLHDLTPHYLPLALRLEQDVRGHIAALLRGEDNAAQQYAFNPLPFSRGGVVETADHRFVCVPNVASCATQSLAAARTDTVQASATTLANGLITLELGPQGQILSVTDMQGAVRYAGAANRLVHWHNVPASGMVSLTTGVAWTEGAFCGNLRLYTEVEVPEDGEYAFQLDVQRGMTIALACEGEDWVPATNRHWGGGLPSKNHDVHSGCGKLYLRKGTNRLVLHAVADEGYHIQSARLQRAGQGWPLTHWQGELLTRWEEDPFRVDHVDTHAAGARATVAFHGTFSSCQAVLTLTLDAGSERVDVHLTRHYAERVHEGFQTLPLPLEIGSYLGSCCERPYVPAFAVEQSMPYAQTRYVSDKPYGYLEAYDDAESWRNGRFRPFYAGLTPFLGIDTALAESPNGTALLLTDGHNHFYRRRDDAQASECLGLSLGSSTIHPQTQSYRMPADSSWEKIGRHMITDYADAHERCDFVAPLGEISCGWSLYFSDQPSLPREFCHRQRLERLFPLMPASRALSLPCTVEGDGVVLAAVEYADAGGVLVRLVNLSASATPFVLTLPWPVAAVACSEAMPMSSLAVTADGVSGVLPPYALRELHLTLKTP